jgi:HD-like signal output (HDOD) protein
MLEFAALAAAFRRMFVFLPTPAVHGRAVRDRGAAADDMAAIAAAAPGLPTPSPDPQRLGAANQIASGRLWKLAFAGPSQPGDAPHRRVRDNVLAKLAVDALDPQCFPRRPMLMSQLLRAVNDPKTASIRISRIIAHDPVLSADVLRMANSSLYRTSAAPLESIQRAIVVCGVDALRAILATAMLRPVFQATGRNFPRFPRLLWKRTEWAARAAELYAMESLRQERFEAQLVVLLHALGPLVVYAATLDVYSRNAHLAPSGELCAELIAALGSQMSLRIARDWRTSDKLQAALGGEGAEPLHESLQVGELLGTLAFLESQTVITCDERRALIDESGIDREAADRIWAGLSAAA